jgi:ubiquinone/menaquinone biosynthesis C-methylase UbiE
MAEGTDATNRTKGAVEVTILGERSQREGEVELDDVELSQAFDDAASRYDLMVALNPGYHRQLASAARILAEQIDGHARLVRLLDLGCGSGASTRALVDAFQADRRPVDIIGVDASSGMLEQAKRKSWPLWVRFDQVFAQELSAAKDGLGLTGQVDGVLAAYLFRNVGQRDETLGAVRDVLRPGGTLVVQEYSVAGTGPAALVWTLVCWLVVIPLSWLASRRTELYRYLWRSVRQFDSVQTFVDRLYRAGFTDVEVRTARGWQRGILHTFRARKPGQVGS